MAEEGAKTDCTLVKKALDIVVQPSSKRKSVVLTKDSALSSSARPGERRYGRGATSCACAVQISVGNLDNSSQP